MDTPTTPKETSKRNNLKKHRILSPKQTVFNSCNTGVYPRRTHGFGCWGNRRVPFCVRVDEKLAKASKPVLKAIFGSTCRGVESILAGIVATYEQQGITGVYPSHTIDIGKLVIERNLRPRRKLVVPEEEITETTEVHRVRKVKKTTRKLAVNDIPDYTGKTIEELDRLHRMYRNMGSVGKSALVVAELKRRGVIQ